MPEIPAAWYPDPFGRYECRYWDGKQWTEHVASLGQQSADSPDPSVQQVSANWYPDPFGRFDTRYWDGSRWTEHVASQGLQTTDAPAPSATPSTPATPAAPVAPFTPVIEPASGRNDRKIQRQVRRAGADGIDGGGTTLFSERVLVVNQKAKLIASALAYTVYDQQGRELGAFREVRDLGTRVSDAIRMKNDNNRSYYFQVTDPGGQVVLSLTRPERFFTSKSSIVVEGPNRIPIGNIVQETLGLKGVSAKLLDAGLGGAAALARLGPNGGTGMAGSAITGMSERMSESTEDLQKFGHARFGLEAGGVRLGAINARAMEAWGFTVHDPNGVEIAEITKTWAGWTKERFTKADNYVVRMHRQLEDPLLSLVIAASLAIDVALKQGMQATTYHRRGLRRDVTRYR